ncbi:LysM peptidoglycan-binding domain-containing protein [Cytophagales bacterium LB-30]|uniref:LysM peptidoglycan-binding domain-containing protein n=1 Tax=Shiella aurantiaca TaxID=3058365 RepID=A0ABT8F688_9BACT|nr:LysM peptidoglycan-binding domain-containing protein [Shiella aurantiaca]MDN4165955.1 LysM peptidoglycan-binding domain-containing protein [Shiella aurantiaca]
MRRLILATSSLLWVCQVAAQAHTPTTIEVPEVIQFADMELHLSPALRKEVQADVDNMLRSPKYLQIKVDRADFYFPIIERIFEEEGLPQDFKYLAIQESALISDAVSSSNAVGFWQFKKETGIEMGLRIDHQVDERLNIVSASRAAAKYLKKHQQYLDNWLHALMSYQAGLGGVQSLIDTRDAGSKRMKLDKQLYWYPKKYLAHKIVFEQLVGKNPEPRLIARELTDAAHASLHKIAKEQGIEEELIKEYNTWLKHGNVPADKTYTVILPITRLDKIEPDRWASKQKNMPSNAVTMQNPEIKAKPSTHQSKDKKHIIVNLNKKEAIIAKEGDSFQRLAFEGSIPTEKFIAYNDLQGKEDVLVGQAYYLQRKSGKAAIHYHTVQAGESMWAISQKYGIRLDKLYKKNRMKVGQEAEPGRVLWLRFTRPAKVAIEYRKPISPTPVQEKEKIKEEQATPAVQDSLKLVPKHEAIDSLKTEPVNLDSVQLAPTDTLVASTETLQSQALAQEVIVPEEEPKRTLVSNHQHTVSPGETLYAIARKYAVSVQEIREWNNFSPELTLQVGDTVKIRPQGITTTPPAEKAPESTEESYQLHTVKAGETMYKVAREYQITVKELMDLNGKTDFNLSEGEQLKIKKIK